MERSQRVERVPKTRMVIESTQVKDVGPHFAVYEESFYEILGPSPLLQLELEAEYPFAHEAGVFIPGQDAVFVTSNRFRDEKSLEEVIRICKLQRHADGSWEKDELSTEVINANGGVDYNGGVIFCSQGSKDVSGGLVWMASDHPQGSHVLVNNFHGRRFNSPNDVVTKSDGSVWFTDPIYGYKQGLCPKPELPSQVYRFEPVTGDLRAVADGFGRPNGLSFAPGERTLFVTDTDGVRGDGTTDDSAASSIYAFDVIRRDGGDFLGNRRLFAMASPGIPDGIKCDQEGNVYAGCGDGLHVWKPCGTFLGKIAIPGGVANFCFGRSGEIFLLNEKRFWVASIAKKVSGALLNLSRLDDSRTNPPADKASL